MNPDPRRWWALAVLATAQFMVIMDTSIIAVALPRMQEDLGFSPSGLQWVFNGYAVAFGGLLLLGGRLSDLFGARRVFATGWLVLIAGSVLAAAAGTPGVEVAGRAVQGVGAALLAPAAMTLLMVLFAGQPAELPKALSFYGAAAPAGGTAGVFLGGVITEWLTWPWVFVIYVPIGLITLALTPATLPAVPGRRSSTDLAGALAVTAGLALAVAALVTAPANGWTSAATLGQLIASVALIAGFLLLQRLVRAPLMPLRIWRTPGLAAANVSMALLGAAWIPMWYFLNLYIQQVLGFGSFASGAALLPMTALIMIGMIGITGRLLMRFGARPLVVTGLLVLAAGLGLLALADPQGSFVADVLPGSLVAAAGMALAFIPATMTAIGGVAPAEGGLASGIVNTTYQVGSALGLAAMTAVAVANGAGQTTDPVELTSGYTTAFTVTAAVALAGALLAALTLRGRKVQSGSTEARPAEEHAAV
ncbi:MAG: MFS transporter [Hamadaea sp.]|nr:MFS transporter [Hamadaea sp.]